MGGNASKIRNSAKAIIIQDGKLLAMRAQDEHGLWYLLPGGGQEPSETLEEALSREVLKETCVRVEIGPVRYIREYFSSNHEFANVDRDFHQVEFMFLCRLLPGQTPALGAVPDKGQDGVEWLDLNRIEEYRLYPQSLRKAFADTQNRSIPVYHGDVN
jgi:8-oxo-dGTP diphosphatase